MGFPSELSTLIGVALGAGLSWSSSALTDRSRFRRDQQVRWREQRLATYADFSTAAKQTMSLLFRVGAHLRVDEQTDPMTLDEARPLLAAAFHSRDQAFERVRMVGSAELFHAARAWTREIYDMRRLVETTMLDQTMWTEQVSRANQTRDAFYDAARQEIGVDTV